MATEGKHTQPSCRWLLMKASQASRCACSELNSCSSPSSVHLRVEIALRVFPFRRLGPGIFIGRARRLGCTLLLAETKEPGTRPMCPGDPLGNHGQRPIPLTVVF